MKSIIISLSLAICLMWSCSPEKVEPESKSQMGLSRPDSCSQGEIIGEYVSGDLVFTGDTSDVVSYYEDHFGPNWQAIEDSLVIFLDTGVYYLRMTMSNVVYEDSNGRAHAELVLDENEDFWWCPDRIYADCKGVCFSSSDPHCAERSPCTDCGNLGADQCTGSTVWTGPLTE